MKKGDIIRSINFNVTRVALCLTNKMPNNHIVIAQYYEGRFVRLTTTTDRWEVIEFADGRINEALFPKNERAEDQRFEEEFYQPEIGQPVRPADRVDMSINAARIQAYAQAIAQRPRWEANPFGVEEDVVNEVGDHVDF